MFFSISLFYLGQCVRTHKHAPMCSRTLHTHPLTRHPALPPTPVPPLALYSTPRNHLFAHLPTHSHPKFRYRPNPLHPLASIRQPKHLTTHHPHIQPPAYSNHTIQFNLSFQEQHICKCFRAFGIVHDLKICDDEAS